MDPQKPELGDVAPGTSDSRQGLASLFNNPCTRQCDAEARIDLPRIGGSLLQSGPIQFGGTGIIAPRKIGVSSLTRDSSLGGQRIEGCLVFRRARSEEHTSELQSLMRISSAVYSLQTQNPTQPIYKTKLKRTTHS